MSAMSSTGRDARLAASKPDIDNALYIAVAMQGERL